MNLRRGVYRVSIVFWGAGVLATLAVGVWFAGNPVAKVHPDGIARPPQLPTDVCNGGYWDDGGGNSLRLVGQGERSTRERIVAQLLEPWSGPGPRLELDASLADGAGAGDDTVGGPTLAFDGVLWGHLVPDAALPERFQTRFASLAACGAFWSEQSATAQARWDRAAVWVLRDSAMQRFWRTILAVALGWTAVVWGSYAVLRWVAKGFESD